MRVAEPEEHDRPLIFRSAPTTMSAPTLCGAASPSRMRLVLGGDLLVHAEQQREAFSYLPPTYHHLFTDEVKTLLRSADITYANFEGVSAPGVGHDNRQGNDTRPIYGPVYSSWEHGITPNAFNYHPSLAADLAWLGVDVVSTANNHAADRGPLGIAVTLGVLSAAGLAVTGTQDTSLSSSQEAHDWVTVVRRRGWAVGFVGCTEFVNRGEYMSDEAVRNAMLWCHANNGSRYAQTVPAILHQAATRLQLEGPRR